MAERSNPSGLVKGSMLGVGVLLAVALTILVNVVGWKYYERFDWTSSKLYSLSEKSLNVLAGLDRDSLLRTARDDISSRFRKG